MEKEKMIKEVGKPILKPLGIVQGIFLLVFLASPFIWIWKDWDIAWKTGLTGLIGTLLVYIIYSLVKRIVTKQVNESLQQLEDNKPKINYHQKLNDMMKKKADERSKRKY